MAYGLTLLALVMLAAGIPVAFVLLGVTLAVVLADPRIFELAYVQSLVMSTQSFPLLAIPLFILAGELLNISGITRRVMEFATVLTGHFIGGLAQVNVALSTLLSGMSGSANADAAMQAKMLVPEMVRRGYDPAFASAITAASSLIAPMIPPGIGLILFGFVTDTSIGRMFLGGIVPGLMMSVTLMVTNNVIARRRGYERFRERPNHQEVMRSFIHAIPAIALPVIVIVGIRVGAFTPSEAGGIAACYALVFCAIYRETTWAEIVQALHGTAVATTAIMLVLAASAAFSWVLTFQQIPQQAAAFLLGITSSQTGMLVAVAGFLLVAGMFVEGTALILILAPMLMPVAQEIGIDPVHFGIVFIFMVHLGGITPPVGTIMFTTCAITQVPIVDFVKASLPYVLALLICAFLIILFPATVTMLAYL